MSDYPELEKISNEICKRMTGTGLPNRYPASPDAEQIHKYGLAAEEIYRQIKEKWY